MSGSPRSIRCSCSVAIGRQSSSKTVAGFPAISSSLALEVLGPQPQPRRAGDLLVVGDDVHLGVVEERVGVEVGRADREPAVVDDADLGVDVDDVAQLSLPRVDGAGEEAVVALVGVDQRGHLPARDVGAVVGARRQEHDDAEVVVRRMRELVGEHVDDLRRPEELVLEVDDLLRRPERGRGTTRGSSSRPSEPPCTSRPAASARPGARRRRPAPGSAGGGSGSPVAACQRRRKCSATSCTAGPSMRAATSCQPMPPRARWLGVSYGSPPSIVRSIPPT